MDHWLNACVIKLRFPTKFISIVTKTQLVDMVLDMGQNLSKVTKYTPGSIEIG